MSDIELSVQVSRDALNLPPLEIATSPNYYLGTQFFGAAVQWDRRQVTSPWADGAKTVSRRRQMVTEQVQVEVKGADLAEVKARINELIQAFLQGEYVLTVDAGGAVRRYRCETADYQNLGWTTPRMVAAQAQILFQVPRQPVPLTDRVLDIDDSGPGVNTNPGPEPVLDPDQPPPDPDAEPPDPNPAPPEPDFDDPEEPEVAFTVGVSKPKLVNPLAPTSADTAGWNGDSSGGTIGSASAPAGPYTVAAGQTVQNMVFWCDVILEGPTSKLKNCMVYGGNAKPFKRFGLVNALNGGQLERVTVYGMAHSVTYWRNAIQHRAGVLKVHRCAWLRVVDGINSDGTTNQVIATSNIGRQFAFFADDVDHQNDRVRPWWTHNDFSQIKGGSMAIQHLIDGNVVDAFFDTTGVTWTGGSPGQGLAKITGPDSVGHPDVALNKGYYDALGRGTWANGISFTNKKANSVVKRNWVNGVAASSGMIMWTGDTAGSKLTVEGNRIRLGGKPSSQGVIYIVQWPGDSQRTIGSGATANKFDNTSDVPAALRNTDVPFTSTGAKVNLNNYD